MIDWEGLFLIMRMWMLISVGLLTERYPLGRPLNFDLSWIRHRIELKPMAIDNVAIMDSFNELRVLSYNIHGGEGPGGEGDLTTNVTTFRNTFMKGEDVLCLQEVGAGNAANTTAA